jgi:hypothetical protein
VVDLRRWVAEVGMKEAIARFRTDATTPLTLSTQVERNGVDAGR